MPEMVGLELAGKLDTPWMETLQTSQWTHSSTQAPEGFGFKRKEKLWSRALMSAKALERTRGGG